jgi:MtN3 and saliva related transmembrane protein
MRDLLGWISSIVLLVTIVEQIHKQWQERSGRGVSRWLFVGQTFASLGFTVYSALLHNWVFTITNAALFFSAIVGCVMTAHFKRAGTRSAPTNASPSPQPAHADLTRQVRDA